MQLKKSTGNTSSFLNIVLIGIFMLAICLPLIKMLYSKQADYSMTEKRKLAKMPSFRMDSKYFENFPAAFESFYKDHFGFRTDLIFGNSYIKAFFLKKSPVDSVVIGKHNWLFYAKDNFDVSLIEDYRGLLSLTPFQLEAMKTNLETKHRWLARQKIKYMFVIAPNKHSIYPEYMPDYLNKVNDESQLDQFIDYMKKNSTIPVVDLRPRLTEEKKNGILYYQTDSHWNASGALVAYHAVIQQLQQWFPEEKIIDASRLRHELTDHSGRDLATLMGLPHISEQGVPSPRVKSSCSKREENPEYSELWPWFTQPFETTCETAKLRAIVFRDSFIDEMLPFFSEHFRQAAYIQSRFDYSITSQLIAEINPDVVIEEGIERHLFMAFSDHEIHNTLGNDHLIMGKTKKAVLEFQKAVRIRPDLPDNHSNLGFALLKMNRLDEAVACFRKALSLDPDHEKASRNLSMAISIIQKLNSELEEIRKRVDVDPENPALRYQFGRLLQKRGWVDSAIEQYNKALSFQPDNVDLLNRLAVIHTSIENYRKAIQLFQKITELQPDKAEAYYNLSCLHAITNQKEASIKWLQAAIHKGYDNVELIQTDTDLENIRNTREYHHILKILEGR